MFRLLPRVQPHVDHARKDVNRTETFMDPIQTSPDSPAFKKNLANRIWGYDIDKRVIPFQGITLEDYFQYQIQQADLFLHDAGQHVLIRTYQHVIETVDILKQNLDIRNVKQQLKTKNYACTTVVEDKLLSTTLDLAVRLSLMIEIGPIPQGFSGYTPLQWTSGKLSTVLAQFFEPVSKESEEFVVLERGLTARNIQRIAGIKFRLTSNLANHLRLDETEGDEVVLNIFHHASFLVILQDSRTSTNSVSALLPQGLVEETLRTLALLFPRSKKEDVAWYMELVKRQNLDVNATLCPHLRPEDRRINKFNFWRERLIILKQAYDEAEPRTWRQWWHDRRRSVHRYPLLLAATALILTVLIGLIQVLVGVFQVYKAYYPN